MKFIKVGLQGLFVILMSFTAPFVMLFALPFIKWDKEPSIGPQRSGEPQISTIMGDLPWWLSWYATPDQRLPGDTGMQRMRDYLTKYGKLFTSWYWNGSRNQCMGLACWFGGPTSDYSPEKVDGMWERTDEFGTIWMYTKVIYKARFLIGYSVYKLTDGTFRSAPIITLKYLTD